MTHILHITSVSRRVSFFSLSFSSFFVDVFVSFTVCSCEPFFFKKISFATFILCAIEFFLFFLGQKSTRSDQIFLSFLAYENCINQMVNRWGFFYLFVCFFNAFFRMAKILIFLGIHKIYVLYYNILEFQNDKKMWTHTPTIDRSKSNDAPDQSKCVTCTQF